MLWCSNSKKLPALVVKLLTVLAALATVANGNPQSACDILQQKYANGDKERSVSVEGRAHELHVYWDGRAPGRAAAALLAAGLRLRLRYARVALRRAPARSLCRLAARLRPPPAALDPYSPAAEPHLVLIPAAVWGEAEAACEALQQSDGAGAVPPRLRVQGAGAAPARLRLQARLAARAARLPLCRNADQCDYISVKLYHPAESRDTAYRLTRRAGHFGLSLLPIPLGLDSAPRRELLTLLKEANYSFLFLDYEIWTGLDQVNIIDLRPDDKEFDLTYTVRLADTWILRQVAPDILQAFHTFKPSLKDLRQVLEIEAERSDSNVTEAACTVALNSSEFENWFDPGTDKLYEVAVFLCRDDPDYDAHRRILDETAPVINDLVNPSFGIMINSFEVECGDEHSLLDALMKRAHSARWARLAGALGAGAGARAAAAAAAALDVALLLYDTPPPLRRARTTRLATGRLRHLVLALNRFVSKHAWTRLAVLSEDSNLASALVKSLNTTRDFVVRDVAVKSNPISALRTVLKDEARIIFVNSNSSVALSVLCAASDLNMSPEAGYVWILREWSVANVTCPNRALLWSHFTISFWWRGGHVPFPLQGSSVKNTIDEIQWAGSAWPLRAAPLVDALKLLLSGFENFLQNHPERQYDLHGGNATRYFWNSLDKEPIQGVTQSFKWDKYGIKNPLVFIDQWSQNTRTPMAIWQAENERITELYTKNFFSESIPSDGAGFCLIKSDTDPFSPKCYDSLCWSALAAGAAALPALALARRVRRRRLARRRLAVAARLLRLAGPLAGALVDRAALQLRAEIGAGRFGVVRAAVLRRAGRPLHVAAKALRDESTPAEEREFLNEALMLASLRHERVVRLVGVCVGGGPPLVLMERALFRDLLGYLRARRPLAGAAGGAGGEAAHVAAAALTRLGAQAAAALAHLAGAGVVHRDVRAANCLVDARRSLKLADFGLARRVAAGGEYACARRGLLPVPWMAPESLARGVFSAASDAWGLGVLLLELATLGARPYGAWPPQRVLRHVAAGGRPPLPPGLAPDTRRVLVDCWRRAAHERPTAAALAARLTAEPEALRPALGLVEDDDRDDTQAGTALLER